MSKRPTRRRILRVAGGAAALAVLGAAGFLWWRPREPDAVLSLYPAGTKLGWKEVGEAYLAAHPNERTGRKLVASLIGEGTSRLKGGAEALREQLRQRVRQDFVDGRLWRLDGWVISETEARLAALAAIAGLGK